MLTIPYHLLVIHLEGLRWSGQASSSLGPPSCLFCRPGWHSLLSSPQTLLWIPMTIQRWSWVDWLWCPPAPAALVSVYRQGPSTCGSQVCVGVLYANPSWPWKSLASNIPLPPSPGSEIMCKKTHKNEISLVFPVSVYISYWRNVIAHVVTSYSGRAHCISKTDLVICKCIQTISSAYTVLL